MINTHKCVCCLQEKINYVMLAFETFDINDDRGLDLREFFLMVFESQKHVTSN